MHRDDDLAYRLEAHFTAIVPIGLVADGLRMDGHFAGVFTAGEHAGADLVGVDYFRLRRDGVGVIDANEVVTVGDATVAVEVRGYLLPPPGLDLPPLEEVAAPGFVWPDANFAIEAFATFTSGAPQLAELNRTVVAHTGTVNFATGRIHVEARRLGDERRRPRRPDAALAAS